MENGKDNYISLFDSDLKKEFKAFCDAAGIRMTAAIHLFIKTTVREQRIPFEIRASSRKIESRIFTLIVVRSSFVEFGA
ncbi:MAG: type II toxin-antitoxin system RelB/DinJ family antitoxin [Megasphaera sp.]|uniref:type II toxin-antitoxin system RelB/DinJ family antitoxin n=1 Tax=Megasphaera sp. TaxID=2023260 RepID=UPI003F0810C6